jgi:hypothetical protein
MIRSHFWLSEEHMTEQAAYGLSCTSDFVEHLIFLFHPKTRACAQLELPRQPMKQHPFQTVISYAYRRLCYITAKLPKILRFGTFRSNN